MITPFHRKVLGLLCSGSIISFFVVAVSLLPEHCQLSLNYALDSSSIDVAKARVGTAIAACPSKKYSRTSAALSLVQKNLDFQSIKQTLKAESDKIETDRNSTSLLLALTGTFLTCLVTSIYIVTAD